MPSEQHVILRQVVEIAIPSEGDGRVVHDTMSRLCQSMLSTVLDRECGALSAPDTLHRLDRVEIDLGHLPWDGWETALSERFEIECGPSLSRAFHAAAAEDGGGPAIRVNSRFELLDHFLRTGVLPWWADASNPALIGDALSWLAREAPVQLTAWTRRTTRQTSALRRLIRTGSDDALRTLLTALQPQSGEFLDRLARSMSRPSGAGSAATRHEAWQSVLQAAALEGNAGAELSSRQEFRETPVGDTLRGLLEGSRTALDHASSPPESSANSWASFLAVIRPHLEPRTHAMLAGWAAPREFHHTPVGYQLRDCLGKLLAVPADRWLALLPGLARAIERLGPSATPTGVLEAVQNAPTPESEVEASEPLVASEFSETDALYVENAGLVLLWPFLAHFFAHLGLIEEKQFKTEAARHRAVGLLQCLAAADRTPPEYLLPLNKVLCGMNLDEVFDFGPPATDAEFGECDLFLAAVIEQAPILKQMSIVGFRGSFLLRPGQLTARDGTWLLRVKRQSYDVVRDRFPWPTQWVRLPWMDAMLQVEW